MWTGRSLFLLAALTAGALSMAGLFESPTEAAELAAAPVYDRRAERLADVYDRWNSTSQPRSDKYELLLGLSWFPGISAERSNATGLAVINMASGTVDVELTGIDRESLGDVWLIDNRPGDGASAMPDATDAMHLVGGLEIDGEIGVLRARLGAAVFRDFDVDQVVVARRGHGPVEGGVLYGSLPLFERLFRASWRLGQGLAPIAGDEGSRNGLLGELPLPNVASAGSVGALLALGTLIDEGEELFFNETFDGNGRTCGTCHPAENNLTLDKDFIRRLPPDNPLFVAEFIDELNHELNGGLFFENPVLMREFALIVENPDGFDDLAERFVMRSANTISALALSMLPSGVPCETRPPFDRLGWGGDGSAGSGTLREFAIGAVIQHNPLTLGRVDGVDFRLPTDQELDALEAFQLSLGRQEELDLNAIHFLDPNVSAGRDSFVDTGNEGANCQVCHTDAGALRKRFINTGPLAGELDAHNVNFDIGVFHVEHPAAALGEPIPFDDGFGTDHTLRRCQSTFNTPSIIEAADTPPFEHNNVFATLEEAIAHYGTDEFNDGSTAGGSLPGVIDLSELEINRLGALLRVLNALHNIEEVTNCDARVLTTGSLTRSSQLLRQCLADNRDAIKVLSEGPLESLHPLAQQHLAASLSLHTQALKASTRAERNAALLAAGPRLTSARRDMVIDP